MPKKPDLMKNKEKNDENFVFFSFFFAILIPKLEKYIIFNKKN